jgi:hypothetical protein
VKRATVSSLSSIAQPSVLVNTPPSSMRITASAMQARRLANLGVFRQCWWSPPASEPRIRSRTRQIADQRHGAIALPVMLTTVDRIRATPLGALGAIWRAATPANGALVRRGYWLRPHLRDGHVSGGVIQSS